MRRQLTKTITISLLLSLTLTSCSGAHYDQTGIASSSEAADIYVSADGEGKLVIHDTDEYENNEMLVMYYDGSYDILTFETEAALGDAIGQLSEDPDVKLIQPNYIYTQEALSSDDPYVAEQWAFENDGNFYMEDSHNEFPVYDSPFGTPYGPGEWRAPTHSGFYRRIEFFFRFDIAAGPGVSASKAGIDIGLSEAWAAYNGGVRDVVVALIDTGIDRNHEDLAGVFWTNDDEIADNGVDDDANGYVDDVYGWDFYYGNNVVFTGSEDNHGTHGAGTIAAHAGNGIGVAGIVQSDHVKIMPLKALGGLNGEGTTAAVMEAIRYAEANGASICNLSIGTSKNDPALYELMASSSMLFVIACGNDGVNIDNVPCYPASYDLDNIISVANLSYDGELHYSSGYGPVSVDLAAPGTYILSTTSGNGYSYYTGTSMAAPMVTAAAAMVYSHYADISLADVKEILLSSTAGLDSLSGLVRTGGMLDLGAAMNYRHL